MFVDPIVIVSDTAVLPRPPGTTGRTGASGAASFAPNIPAGTWPAAALPVPFVLALPRSRDVGAEAAAELDVALRAWSRPTCTGWRARFDGERAAVAADDGVNVVVFHDDAWPAELVAGAVGQTVIHTDRSGRYRDADIHINGKDFRFSLDGRAGTLDLRSVLVHELGHALGLGHSGDARASMFATGSGLRWRSLESDDAAGVCALYPGQGAAGCESSPCPPPFVCVAGACQRPRDARDVCSPCERVVGACEGAGDGARCVDIAAGRVCGRGCGADRDCGDGFACVGTSAAGDLQCVSNVDCKNGANRCATDAECSPPGVCRGGACVGLPGAAADGGSDAGMADGAADAAARAEDGEPGRGGGGGCDCRATVSGPRASAPRSGAGTRDGRDDREAPTGVGLFGVVALCAALRRRPAA